MKTKEQMKLAVAVAKDVLKQVKAGTITPEHRMYLAFNRSLPKSAYGKQLQKYLRPCKACALGATFISLVKLKNDFVYDGYEPYDHEMRDSLLRCFTPQEIVRSRI
jgi:hypothetical protein